MNSPLRTGAPPPTSDGLMQDLFPSSNSRSAAAPPPPQPAAGVGDDSDSDATVTSATAARVSSPPPSRLRLLSWFGLGKRGGHRSAGRASDYRATMAEIADAVPPQQGPFARALATLRTFYRFIGPGFIVSVAYIDPGNYSTGIAAGASYRYRLLFVVLLSNLFAIFLQSMAVKLGTVTGQNLAVACRAHLPRWLNISLYVMAEVAIIATDVAEVIGTAIALNLLSHRIPLVAGCALSIVDVLIVLAFCKPEDGTRRGMRAFELLIVPLVLAVVVCFCIQLSMIDHAASTVGHVFRGYLPSSVLVQGKGLYQACGILGATVMPHSLYLGSGIVQARLREFDDKAGLLPSLKDAERANASVMVEDLPTTDNEAPRGGDDDRDQTRDPEKVKTPLSCAQIRRHLRIPTLVARAKTYTYLPSLSAIKHCYAYSVVEVTISLFSFALFVNSAILIVAGSSLYGNPDADDADIFAIHRLLSSNISTAAGTVFALALLLSGLSAGVVCTVAGQMICEGAVQWRLAPWLRRLLTRTISIMPSIIIAAAVGRAGLDSALNASQVVLSVVLPFVTAPLLWFTSFNKYMTVQPGAARFTPRGAYSKTVAVATTTTAAGGTDDGTASAGQGVSLANSWPVAILGFAIWLLITVLNIANIVLLARGQ